MTNIDSVDAPSLENEEKEKPKIISVDFLDGADTMPHDRTQWVNLPRDGAWVDGRHVINEDRLGLCPRVKVAFDQKGSHKFRLKLDPGGSNTAYLAVEKGRNNAYTYTEQERTYSTDADGTKIIEDDWLLNCCGTNVWRLRAEDEEGNQVESRNLTGKRLVHLVEVPMRGVTVHDNLNVLNAEYQKHGVVFEMLGRETMTHFPTIQYNSEIEQFQNHARVAYNKTRAPSKEPYTLCVTYTDHLAEIAVGCLLGSGQVNVGPKEPPVRMPVLDNNRVQARLWHNIESSQDWWLSCFYTPYPEESNIGKSAGLSAAAFATSGATVGAAFGGPLGAVLGAFGAGAVGAVVGTALHTDPAEPTPIPIPKSRCKPIGDFWKPQACSFVEIDVTGLPEGSGEITLMVNIVDKMNAGLAFTQSNLICIAMRAYWDQTSELDQNKVLIHEIGHKLHMVCEGKNWQPEECPTLYHQKGHQGPHCHFPLAEMDYYRGKGSDSSCVMFGEVNETSAYCDNCIPGLLKMDLSAGWRPF